MAAQRQGARRKRQNVRHAADEIDPVTGELLAEVVDVEDPDNPKRVERVRRAASPLRRLFHAKGIDDAAYEAGRRFSGNYTAARMGPRYSLTNADRILAPAGARGVEQLVADSMAAEECAGAIESMGELGGSLLQFVIGQEMTIDDWVWTRARTNRWGAGLTPQGAGWVLRQVLGSLAQWYRWYDRGYYRPLRSAN